MTHVDDMIRQICVLLRLTQQSTACWGAAMHALAVWHHLTTYTMFVACCADHVLYVCSMIHCWRNAWLTCKHHHSALLVRLCVPAADGVLWVKLCCTTSQRRRTRNQAMAPCKHIQRLQRAAPAANGLSVGQVQRVKPCNTGLRLQVSTCRCQQPSTAAQRDAAW